MKNIILIILSIVVVIAGINFFSTPETPQDPLKIRKIEEAEYTQWEKVCYRLAEDPAALNITIHANNLLDFANQLKFFQKKIEKACIQENLSPGIFLGIGRSLGQAHAYSRAKIKALEEVEGLKLTWESLGKKPKKKNKTRDTVTNTPEQEEDLQGGNLSERARARQIVREHKFRIWAEATEAAGQKLPPEELEQKRKDIEEVIFQKEQLIERDFSEDKLTPVMRHNLELLMKHEAEIESLWKMLQETFQRRNT